MCVRYNTIDERWEKFVRRQNLWVPTEPPLPKGKHLPSLFPGDQGAIGIPNDDGLIELVPAQWGVQPSWAKRATWGKTNAYNARSETIFEKPTFRDSIRRRRCVIPLTSFYERADRNSNTLFTHPLIEQLISKKCMLYYYN